MNEPQKRKVAQGSTAVNTRSRAPRVGLRKMHKYT
jgi:hypothetical protein